MYSPPSDDAGEVIERNYDPSRDLVFEGPPPIIPLVVIYGRASRPDSVGAVYWHPAAVDAGLDRGTRCRNNDVRDHSARR